jgi:hypothetical protein
MRVLIRLIWVVACVVIGTVIALALFELITWIKTSGYFEGWDKLPTAPTGAVELFNDKRGSLYVRTSSREVYRYTWGTEDEDWVKDEPSQNSNEVDYVKVTKPCDFSSPELGRFKSTANTIDCTQTYKPEPEGFVRHTYVLDQDGTVWHWHHSAAAYGGIIEVLACTAVSGGIVGLVAGIRTARLVFNKRRI